MQIIIHGERQIRLAAAKINDHIFPVLIQLRQDILNKFQKTVDLSKFVVTAFYYLSIRGLHAKIYQERDRMPLRNHVTFLAVMLQLFLQFFRKLTVWFCCLDLCRSMSSGFHRGRALFTD